MADSGIDFSAPYRLIPQEKQTNPFEMAGQAVDVQNKLLANQTGHYELATKQLSTVRDNLTGLLNAPNLSPGMVSGTIDAMAANGLIPRDMAAREKAQIPTDPGALKQYLTQHLLANSSNQQKIDQIYGVPTQTNLGGSVVTNRVSQINKSVNPMGGSAARQENTVSPGLTDGPNINGQPTKVTNQQAQDIATGKARVDGSGRIVYGNAPAAAPASTAAPAGSPVTDPAAQAPTAAPAPAGVAPMPVGAPMGANVAADVNAKASADASNALQGAADASPARRGSLANLEDDLAKITTGPAAEKIRKAKAGFNQLSGVVGGPQIDPEGVAAGENFNKQATMLAQQQFTALGGTGTDSQLGSAIKSNPNEALSKLGNRGIITLLKGNEDAITAKNEAWQAWKAKNGADSYPAFANDFNKSFSPRAFQFVHQTPAERAAMLQTMSPAEKSQLGTAINQAEKRGWIKPDAVK